MSEEWATWTCATCGEHMADPVRVRATVCSSGHTNYLGPVYQQHRGAFKTKSARLRMLREDQSRHAAVQGVLRAWARL